MARRLVAIVLFFFVVVSLGAIYVRSEKARTDSPARAQPPTSETKVIAYYFHVSARCVTCRNIESYAREVVERKFAGDIAQGRVEFRSINVQRPENHHFVKDYQLFTKSLVLVRLDHGRQAEYKVLHDTWELAGSKQAMQDYVEREVRDYLKRLS